MNSTHILAHMHGSSYEGPVGIGWCACDMSTTYMPSWLGWLAGCPSMVRTLSDLWGGVNGHGVNQCGVCDDVTG